jgi:GTP-binding protein EngB required for normal cell division
MVSAKGIAVVGGNASSAPNLAAKLDAASGVLAGCLGSDSPLAARFDSLRDRLRHNKLQLAVLGQFKRGKSSFINALLGAPVLPIAVVPLTAVPIFISWGATPSVRVAFKDGRADEELSADDPDAIREFLFRFVAEEANPENRLRVNRVDLFYPATILTGGTVLIDTPGVGSTLRHNTEAAIRVVPESDAALFVVSPDPPITEAELEYLRGLKSKVAKILFILNKADYVRIEERTRLADFLRDVLKRNGLWSSGSVIFNVSARDGLDAKQHGDRTELESSGLPGIEDHLRRYLADEKAKTLAQAVARKAEGMLCEAATELDLRAKALSMPLDELSSKSQLFEQALRSIEGQRHTVQDFLAGEQRRLVAELKSRTDSLHEEVCAKLSKVADDELERAEAPAWKAAAQERLAVAIETTFDRSREELIASFSDDVNAAFAKHQRRFEDLINGVRRAAADIFEIQFYQRAEDSAFELTNDPYWVTQHTHESLIPDPSGLVDRLLPQSVRRARLRDRVVRRTNELVLRNTSNLHWALLQSINDTFRKAGSQFEERLNAAIQATRVVIEATLERRRARSFEVEPEIVRVGEHIAALAICREEIVAELHSEGGSAPGAAEGGCCGALGAADASVERAR